MGTALQDQPSTSTTWDPKALVSIEDRDARIDAVADLLGMPRIGTLPTPGDASSWGPKEWESWAVGNGFRSPTRTKHSFKFDYDRLPDVCFGVPTTTGDFRSSMAVCKQMRAKFLLIYNRVLLISEALAKDPDGELSKLVHLSGHWLLSGGLTERRVLEMALASDANGTEEGREELFRIAKMAEKEFGLSFYAFVMAATKPERLTGRGDEQNEVALKSMQSYVESLQLGGGRANDTILSLATEHLACLREQARDLNDQKRRAREADLKEREERQAAKHRAPTAGELHAAEMAKVQKTLATEAQQLGNLAKLLGERAAHAQNMLASAKFPDPKIDALEARAKAAEAQLAAVTLDRDGLNQELTKALLTPKPQPHQDLLPEFEEVVRKVSTLLAEESFTKLVFNLDEARKELAAISEIIAEEVLRRTPKGEAA
jgi:hypothetical protein